jgi:hypothetical protein
MERKVCEPFFRGYGTIERQEELPFTPAVRTDLRHAHKTARGVPRCGARDTLPPPLRHNARRARLNRRGPCLLILLMSRP